jgi:hypothetical protein
MVKWLVSWIKYYTDILLFRSEKWGYLNFALIFFLLFFFWLEMKGNPYNNPVRFYIKTDLLWGKMSI